MPLLPLLFGGHARAAENEGKVITLFCEGTLTRTYGANKPAEPEPLQKTSVVLNLDEQSVFFLGYIVPIEDVDQTSINFGGRQSGRFLDAILRVDRLVEISRQVDINTIRRI